MEFPVKQCLLGIYTHKASLTPLPQNELNKDNNNGHAK